MYKVDLNSDLGESFGLYRIGCDEEIIKTVSSVNIACGVHAGDPMVMDQTVKMCMGHGVAVGSTKRFCKNAWNKTSACETTWCVK